MVHEHSIYVIIEGDPWLTRAKEYHAAASAMKRAWWSFAKLKGAQGVSYGNALCFHGQAPTGWTKPKGKHEFSYPKKGSQDAPAFAALPRPPCKSKFFESEVLFDIAYQGPKHSGSGGIGHFFFGPDIGWAGDVYWAIIPDAAAAAKAHLEENPDDTITNGADKWVLPEGLRRVSEAEIDLIVAQYKVAQQRKAGGK